MVTRNEAFPQLRTAQTTATVTESEILTQAENYFRSVKTPPLADYSVQGELRNIRNFNRTFGATKPTEEPQLDGLMSRVEKRMAGKSQGTIESCKSLVAKVCKKYEVTSIVAALAEKAVTESCLPPWSKSDLKLAMKIAASV